MTAGKVAQGAALAFTPTPGNPLVKGALGAVGGVTLGNLDSPRFNAAMDRGADRLGEAERMLVRRMHPRSDSRRAGLRGQAGR
jgi:hypothetical protein